MLLIAITAAVLYTLLPWIADQFGLSRQAGFLGGVAAALVDQEWHGHGEYLTGIVLALLLVAFLRSLIIPLATYPLIYYLVAYMPRYRAPIDWILFVLVGSLVWRAIGGFRAGHMDLTFQVIRWTLFGSLLAAQPTQERCQVSVQASSWPRKPLTPANISTFDTEFIPKHLDMQL